MGLMSRGCGCDCEGAVEVMGDGGATKGKKNIFVGIRLKNALYRPRYISYRVYRLQYPVNVHP